MTDFNESDHPRAANGQFGSGGSTKKAQSKVKLKENHIQLETPVKAEKNVWGEYEIDGHQGTLTGNQITVSKGHIVGMRPKVAEHFGFKTVGEIKPESEKTIAKKQDAEAKKAVETKENKEKSEAAVFYMTFNNQINGLSEKGKKAIAEKVNQLKNDKSLTEIERVRALKTEISNLKKTDHAQDQCLAYDRGVVDKSVRSKDANGFLHVEFSHISKAAVNPYYGREIPNSTALGLEQDRIYYLLRDPEELKKGASTFNRLPILIKHDPVSSADTKQDLTVGATGSDARFDAPYLDVSLTIWEAAAIAGIESKEQTQISSAYRYTADMTAGVYEGEAYDGVMRDIEGNHVALVDVGRAGSDVVVQDRDPFNQEVKPMTRKERLLAKLRQSLTGVIAQDQDIEKILLGLDEDIDDATAEDEDEDDDEKSKKSKTAEDEDDDDKSKSKTAEDEDDDKEEAKAAMDRAIAIAKSETESSVIARMSAIRTAEKDVAPLVGEVSAMDSAEAIYKFALDHAGVDIKGVDPSAYGAMVKMLKTQKTESAKPKIAQDSGAMTGFASRFPNAKLPRLGA